MIVALTLAAAVSAAEPPRQVYQINPDGGVGVTSQRCREVRRRYVQDNGVGGGVRPLGELPPGVLTHTVLKTVDGCPVNVLMERGPDGRKLEVPAGPAGLRSAPVSERQRLPERGR